MIKNNKKILIVFTLILGVFTITGCGKETEKLVGTWKCNYEGIKSTYIFEENGKGSQKITVEGNTSDRSYTYKTKNDKLLITFDDDKEYEFPYGYRFDKEKLILKDSTNEEFSCEKK